MIRRVSMRLPRALDADIERAARDQGVSVAQFFATAGAEKVGYIKGKQTDAAELDRLSARSDWFDRRLARIEGILFRRRAR